MSPQIRNPLIVGAGPAGLTAAIELVKRGVTPRLYEASGNVGGLARTPSKGDWRVDPGGHRFFTRYEKVMELWNSLLPPDQWTTVERRSAMIVHGHYVRYPLVGRDLLTQMGFRRGMQGLGSFVWSRTRRGMQPAGDAASFREWGTEEFGRYWYETFFDGYVRKTWQADPDGIASDWANQRIRPIGWHLSKRFDAADQDVFRYPRHGPGQVWDAAAAQLAVDGVVPALNSRVVKARFDGREWTLELHSGELVAGDVVFSSMPLRSLVGALEPAPPRHIRAVAAELKYRGLITVAVALRGRHDIPFHWVYTPGTDVKVGRIQNYERWSSGLAPDGWEGTFLGLEYFIGSDGDVYEHDDEHLTRIALEDLRALGIGDSDVEQVMVVRFPFAYPICDAARDRNVARIRNYLHRNYPTLRLIGRNGMHRYDNQDHAMLSAMHSVAQYFGEDVDPWQVNTDRGYHEAGLLKR